MRVCHINLAKGFRGGERQTLLLVTALAEQNIQQQLVVRYDSPLVKHLSSIDCEIITVKKPYWASIFSVKHHANIIHAHEAKAAQWALLNNLARKIPYLITRRVPNQPKHYGFTRQVYQRAAKVIALSQAIKDSLSIVMDTQGIETIPDMYANLVQNTENNKNIKKRYQDKFVIGHIGALINKHKGQAYLIEAARQLQQQYPQIHFVLLGNGYDEAKLKQQAIGLSNIDFVGFVDDVGSYLHSFDLFAFPSLQEGMGSVLLDAMQAKLPIVASDVGGIPDIIQHGQNGLLVPPADTHALASAIETLYKNTEQRNQLAQAATQGLDVYSPAHIAQRYLHIYQKILNSRQ